MTTTEKAIELCEKMLNGFQFTIDDYTAKQCALIAVDEIIDVLCCNMRSFESTYKIGADEYWEQVKTEIQAL
jgi:hypothetical protein